MELVFTLAMKVANDGVSPDGDASFAIVPQFSV
jgi:hypothetical protein